MSGYWRGLTSLFIVHAQPGNGGADYLCALLTAYKEAPERDFAIILTFLVEYFRY